jgi:deoxyribodipyrimidine photo-lyase
MQVESDVVVPVDAATRKAEYAARTIRPKLRRHWERYLVGLRKTPLARDSLGLKIEGLDLSNVDAILDTLKVDRSVPANLEFVGGTTAAKRLFRRFLDRRLAGYDEHRNQPETDYVSDMSKYLHFGQVSPVWLALRAREAAGKPTEDRESFLDELLVRRELAQNFCEHTPNYDRYACLPKWARATLEKHREDCREHVYTQTELEDARTHDPYWNAAMREMRYTGYMHNYMRMYWGKKIIQWTQTPEHAYKIALSLNNKYFIDGRDANSFANVAWCFGLHDRPWQERPIFGKVRYMSISGLKRKADPDAYVAKVDRLVKQPLYGMGADRSPELATS